MKKKLLNLIRVLILNISRKQQNKLVTAEQTFVVKMMNIVLMALKII